MEICEYCGQPIAPGTGIRHHVHRSKTDSPLKPKPYPDRLVPLTFRIKKSKLDSFDKASGYCARTTLLNLLIDDFIQHGGLKKEVIEGMLQGKSMREAQESIRPPTKSEKEY
jgi:hypothetical protein